jgi:hemerythrin superfamily protein
MQSDVMELPVRGSNALEILMNDHQTIKSLLDQLSRATQQSERKQSLERLKAALTIHNATEENLVYPALDVVAHKRWEPQKLYHETAMADILLFELDTMLKTGDTSDFEQKCQKLVKAINEHIEDEEEKAFVHLRDKAESNEMQMLTESVREFRGMLHMGPMGGRMETGEISTGSQTRSTI